MNGQYFDERNLSDYEFELMREIAGQIAGYEPSEMWGRLTRERPMHSPYYYEKIMNADSQQEIHNMHKYMGGKFTDVARHVLHVGSQIVKGVGKASNYLSRNPYLYKNIPILGQVDPHLFKLAGDALQPVGDLIQKGADAIPNKRRKLNDGKVSITSNAEIERLNPIELHHKKVEFHGLNKVTNDLSNNPNPRVLNQY